MIHRGVFTVLTILFAGTCAGTAAAQNSQPTGPRFPCESRAQARQFDFWIGEWNVTANGKPAGTNSVQRILGQCVIFENWTSAVGGEGKSMNFFNAQTGKWRGRRAR